jgi:hypothetical protein
MSMESLASDPSPSAGGAAHRRYTLWDARKLRGCKCDPGFWGPACDNRHCPRGDDPLTIALDITRTETTSNEVVEVQRITMQTNFPAGILTPWSMSGQATLVYTDLYQGVWRTRPFNTVPTTRADTLKRLLLQLPGRVLQSLEVSVESTAATSTKYQVTFIDEDNTGEFNNTCLER